ncbi:BgtA-20184 [Blumeria graminis f. sp. tritici]|uniref:BgtA-20184 n=2 Tax=Blumeria graminis f. sp. tritici TaxID=62690 RepID=A0A9X9MPZ4_BLUGR|nr:hypothetical protein BGT96224_A20184 [Blumeria graminis f. sp. tritici 96224]VDB96376.1 BgtA-20184 [Blumeria graminis f. sp. tritici]
MDRKPKIVWQLNSPYAKIQWPEVSTEHKNNIIELLNRFLHPIGQYRSSHASPSKGKRSKRRAKNSVLMAKSAGSDNYHPPAPEITSSVIVGLNNVVRRLESLSNIYRTRASKPHEPQLGNEAKNPYKAVHSIEQHFSAIFVVSDSLPQIIHEHLPELVIAASLATPQIPGTRLIQLPTSCSTQLCLSLGLPSVSTVGILEGAPHSKSLIEFVRQCVPMVISPWFREVKCNSYLPVQVKAIESSAPLTKKEQKKPDVSKCPDTSPIKGIKS